MLEAVGLKPMNSSAQFKLIQAGLAAAIAVPIIYFGAQLVAAPYFPGYSFAVMPASLLGTQDSQHPWIFNGGAILTGLAAFFAAYGLYWAARMGTGQGSGTGILLRWLIAAGVAANGVMSVKAGLFPMPDPRHSSWGALVAFMVLTPILLLILSWAQPDARVLKAYLVLSDLFLLLLVPFMMGIIHLSWMPGGTQQRLFAVVTFCPVGAVGYFFLRRLRESSR